jgi:hypothetical protein
VPASTTWILPPCILPCIPERGRSIRCRCFGTVYRHRLLGWGAPRCPNRAAAAARGSPGEHGSNCGGGCHATAIGVGHSRDGDADRGGWYKNTIARMCSTSPRSSHWPGWSCGIRLPPLDLHRALSLNGQLTDAHPPGPTSPCGGRRPPHGCTTVPLLCTPAQRPNPPPRRVDGRDRLSTSHLEMSTAAQPPAAASFWALAWLPSCGPSGSPKYHVGTVLAWAPDHAAGQADQHRSRRPVPAGPGARLQVRSHVDAAP